MEQRRWPLGTEAVSVLGWTLPPRAARDLTGLREVFRRSTGAGINLLDLSLLAPPSGTERIALEALSAVEGTVHIMIARGDGIGVSGGRAGDLPTDLRRSLDFPKPSPAADLRVFIQWVEGRDRGRAEEAHQALSDLVRDRSIAGWGAAIDAPGARSSSSSVGDFSTGSLSILDRQHEGEVAALGVPFLARDPFSGGRMDGSRLADLTRPIQPRSGPVPIRELSQELAPVLELGFLVEGTHRTLAQAALRWTAGRPGVTAVLAPLPPPERFAEIVRFEETPALSAEELARIDRLRSPTGDENKLSVGAGLSFRDVEGR